MINVWVNTYTCKETSNRRFNIQKAYTNNNETEIRTKEYYFQSSDFPSTNIMSGLKQHSHVRIVQCNENEAVSLWISYLSSFFSNMYISQN